MWRLLIICSLANVLAEGNSTTNILTNIGKSIQNETNKTSNVFANIGKGIEKEIAAAKQPIEEAVVYIGSSQCSTVKKIIGVSYEQLEGDKEPDLDSLKLEYRDQSVRVIFDIDTAAARIVNSSDYHRQQNLFIFIHGFTDDPNKDSFGNISDSLLSKGNCNVLALDASSLIKWLYLRSSTYVSFIGQKLGEVLVSMVNNGVDPSKIHIIGHSLGAHISGFTGKQFKNLTGYKIGRISGLDPAGPCFSHVQKDHRLMASDAEFVDVIHTDAGVYGLVDKVGHVDYFPNGGDKQPNCFFQTCSHSRAWLYYAESVKNETAFPAVKCKDWDHFKRGRCNTSDVSYMGFPSKPSSQGIYYLQTGEESPYGLGEKGLKFKNNQAILENLGDQAKSLFG